MANVANCMNTSSTPSKAHMGPVIPDSQENVVLSPGVKEAMDRIFPLSASQLLQGGLTFGEDSMFNVSSFKGTKETANQTRHPMSAHNDVASVGDQCSNTSTAATSDSAVAASLGFMLSSTTSGSTSVSSSPALTTSSHSSNSPGALCFDSNKDSVESSRVLDSQKNMQAKGRISKADFEIFRSCALINEYERSTRRINCTDASSSECHSRNESDSEDMRRPFATIAREKKKRKRKKKHSVPNADNTNSHLSENNGNSGDEFQQPWKANEKTASENGRIGSHTDYVPKINTMVENSLEFNNGPQGLSNLSAKEALFRDYGMPNEDISNISYSSSKENVNSQKRIFRQKLPKTKRQQYHVVKHSNKIKNTFLPCFVVLERADKHNYISVTENILPLSVRVRKLAEMCDKGAFLCRQSKSILTTDIVYKNIFTEIPYFDIDDDFEKPRARSLRKRDKNISYVEPSEDDILVEFSRKHSRRKNGETYLGKSSDESSSDCKKGKKRDVSKNNSLTGVSSSVKKDSLLSLNQKRTGLEKDADNTALMGDLLYPHSSLSNTHPYYSRIDGSGMASFSVIDKPPHILYPQDPGTNMPMMQTDPAHISILANCTIPGAFPHHPSPVSLFPSLPTSFRTLPPPSPRFIGGPPSSCPVPAPPSGQSPQQFCVVKMNGKDVILTLVPSSGIGMPQPMLLQKGNYAPPPAGHLTNQPVQPHLSPTCSQSMLTAISSVAPAAHNNTVSSSFQSLFGLSMLNRPTHTGSHNIPLAALPVVPPAHLGYGSTIGMRPISMSPGTLGSHGPISLPAPSPAHITSHVSTAGIRPVSLTSGTYVSHSSSTSSTSVPAPSHISIAPRITGSSGIRTVSFSAPVTAHSAVAGTAAHSILTGITTNSAVASIVAAHSTVTSVTTHSSTFTGVTAQGAVTGLTGHVFSHKTPGNPATLKSIPPSLVSLQASSSSSSASLASMSSPVITSIVRNVHAPPVGSLQDLSTTQSDTVRIFVPGCSTSGMPSRFATLRSLVNTNPLTRLSANSSLLPQCKRNSDEDLSPEQRAAKRRKLEKKYPLPPGVVIKTEPLDAPAQPTVTTSTKSLLTTNIQLLSTAMPGSNVQRFRLVNPSWAAALALRNASAGSDVVYRTASVGSGQTVLVSASPALSSTSSPSTPPALTSSLNSSTSHGALAYISRTTVNPSTNLNSLISSRTQSTEHSEKSLNSSTNYPNIAPLSSQLVTPPVYNPSEMATLLNGSSRPSSVTTSSDYITTPHSSSSSSSKENTQLPPNQPTPPPALDPGNAKSNLEQLRKMIMVQESLGLKGERLNKLKELLHQKEQYYINSQRPTAPPMGCYGDQTFHNGGNKDNVESVNENGSSEANPFVID